MAQTDRAPRHDDPVSRAEAVLREGLGQARGPVALACSFSLEDVAVIHLLHGVAPETRVFALDTGRLPEETYEVAEAVRRRFGLAIEWYVPEAGAVERLERERGLFSFRDGLDERRECCRVRKVEPLGRALAGLAGWITGLRADQAASREGLAPIGTDALHGGILKINPLAGWSAADVRAYRDRHHLPANPLYGKGYASIGCAPCTRPVRDGEHERAGRWWWENPEHKECGLHARGS